MAQLYKDEALRDKLALLAPLQAQKYSWQKAADVIWDNIKMCKI
jgi:hypothetical protein